MTTANPPRMPDLAGTAGPNMKVTMGVVAEGNAYRLTVNGRPATTPRGHPVVVPTRALAEAIAGEIAADPRRLAGRGMADPAAAPNFRIAAGAIDVIAGEPGARAAHVRDLAAYGGTDLVCIRADGPDALVAREDRCWGPICAWFAGRFGVELAVGQGLRAPPQPDVVLEAIKAAVSDCDDFRFAALSLATRAAGSVVIGLALVEGAIDVSEAFEAATLEESFQAERWGDDGEAARARAARRLDLEQAAGFVKLLSEE